MGTSLFRFFISGIEKEVAPDSHLWQLPLSGKNIRQSCDSSLTKGLTTGDYYLAACEFLSKDNFSILKIGLKFFFDKSIQAGQISQIKIFLEKHGAFYHPLKIDVVLDKNTTCSFVLNGAVSKQGISLIKTEYDLLSRINQINKVNQIQPALHLPQVFGFDFIGTNKGKVGFFLGQWFENYKEFHISDDNKTRQITIWESDGTCHYIEMEDAFGIYQKIAEILTYYYDLETFKQILSWHHAAGDFIVSLENGKLRVKLITVRAYSPLTKLGAGENDINTYILPSLLFFFMDMTIRIRIDRLNGTGETVLIDEDMLNSVIKGFLSALDEKSAIYDYGDLKTDFIEFFFQFDLEQLCELAENIVQSCYFDPLEIKLIEENLKIHCKTLYTNFKNIQK